MHLENIKEVRMWFWRCKDCDEASEAEKEPPLQVKCYFCDGENLDLECDWFME